MFQPESSVLLNKRESFARVSEAMREYGHNNPGEGAREAYRLTLKADRGFYTSDLKLKSLEFVKPDERIRTEAEERLATTIEANPPDILPFVAAKAHDRHFDSLDRIESEGGSSFEYQRHLWAIDLITEEHSNL